MFRSSMDRREEYPSLRPAAIRFRRQKYRTGGDPDKAKRGFGKKTAPKEELFFIAESLAGSPLAPSVTIRAETRKQPDG